MTFDMEMGVTVSPESAAIDSSESPSVATDGTAKRVLNAFTVDVEDYFQVSAFEGIVKRSQWETHHSRVVTNTHKLLKLLEQHQTRATFFVLGWVADRYPQLVRDIDAAGHEIGCHSYWHRLVYDLTPDAFRDDVRLSRDVLQQILGRSVTAYRAPSFSITQRSTWALDILADEGFTFDSSIYPIYHDRYGMPQAERFPHVLETQSGSLTEFAPAVLRLPGVNLPVSGCGYFRLYPVQFSAFCLGQINRTTRQPFIFYVHPWELDPEQPRFQAKYLTRFRHYTNLNTTERKLAALLKRFQFGAAEEAVCRGNQPDGCPPLKTIRLDPGSPKPLSDAHAPHIR